MPCEWLGMAEDGRLAKQALHSGTSLKIFGAGLDILFELCYQQRYDGFGGPAKISSDSDVFVAGGEYDYDAMQYRGIILHHDGTGWKKTSQGPRRSLEGIGADIFVIGGEHDGTGQSPGVILHYDGTAWTPMDSGASDYLYGIWGCSGTDILAVGHAGTIMHHDGTDWHEMSSGAEMNLRGVWGSSGSDVFATKQALHSGQSFC